jgi:hypothetical protein
VHDGPLHRGQTPFEILVEVGVVVGFAGVHLPQSPLVHPELLRGPVLGDGVQGPLQLVPEGIGEPGVEVRPRLPLGHELGHHPLLGRCQHLPHGHLTGAGVRCRRQSRPDRRPRATTAP